MAPRGSPADSGEERQTGWCAECGLYSLEFWRQVYDNDKKPLQKICSMKTFRYLLCLAPMFLAGCGLMPRTGTPSEALLIADEMGIVQVDVSRQKFEEEIGATGAGKNYDGTVTGLLMLASSGGPAALLLGGNPSPSPNHIFQIAVWVPESKARDGKDAIAVADKWLTAAWAKHPAYTDPKPGVIFPKAKLLHVLSKPAGQQGLSVYSQLAQYMVYDYVPALVPAPAFMKTTERVYGPMYLSGYPLSDLNPVTLANLSANLPEWIYMYSPGKKGVLPAAFFNKGKPLYFVTPE